MDTYAEPTAERMRHADGDFTIGNARDRRDRSLRMLDSPFERAYHRGALGKAETADSRYAAGVKFRYHFERGGLRGVLRTVDLNGMRGTGDFGFQPKTDEQAFHRIQYRNAEKMTGPVSAALLRWVVCEGHSLEQAGKALGWKNGPQGIGAATERLKAALDQLRGLWGI